MIKEGRKQILLQHDDYKYNGNVITLQQLGMQMCNLYWALGCAVFYWELGCSVYWMCSFIPALGCAVLYREVRHAVCIGHLDVQFYIMHLDVQLVLGTWTCSFILDTGCAVYIEHLDVQFQSGTWVCSLLMAIGCFTLRTMSEYTRAGTTPCNYQSW
jgi:hypothetical protein